MKIKDALIAWNPANADWPKREAGPGAIRVNSLRLNWETHWDAPYLMTSGGCYSNVAGMSDIEARHFVMSTFIGIIVGDGVDIQAAHREFLKIEEYRRAIPLDLPGAEPSE